MGHYRSEMYSAEELDAERKAEEEQLQAKAERIQKRIDEKGLAYVLAEMNKWPSGRVF